MQAGAGLILGGRLPADHLGRRVGEPDLVLRERNGPGYRVVDIKHHICLEVGKAIPARCSELADPWWETPAEGPAAEGPAAEGTVMARRRRDDLLQLAHYQAMLEAAGLAAAGGRSGGIIGLEERIVWHDLDAPVWSTPSNSANRKKRSSMEVYGFEFDFRLDVIARAMLRRAGAPVEAPLVAVQIAECAGCPWWAHCGATLEAGYGDVSLLAGIGWREWKIHRDHGVGDRAALARLDPRTASLVAAGMDVAKVMDTARQLAPDTPIDEVVGARRPAQLERLRSAGVLSAADAMGLCERTASYSGAGLSVLAAHIDSARAAIGAEVAYRRRGANTIPVPRGEVEVDIDLESVEEGVYLWGALVTDRAGCGLEEGYRAFVSFEPMIDKLELGVFEDFWRWLTELRGQARARGATLRAYCYNKGVETNNMIRLGRAAGCGPAVEDFVASQAWVDLLEIVRATIITGTGHGLKVLAGLAGYRWPVEDPGGEVSMLKYDTAVAAEDEAEGAEAREWLLAYNRGDVEATVALRDWLDANANSIRKIEDWVPPALVSTHA